MVPVYFPNATVGVPLWMMIVAAVLITILGSARLSRIITHDDFPPAVWARIQWDTLTKDGPWSKLAHCHWCATPWITLVCISWGALSSFHWSWWLFWGWLALAYVASIILARDEPA